MPPSAQTRDGPSKLAHVCQAAGVPLIHVSTDYVFDGRKGAPVCRDGSDRTARRLRHGEQAGR